jgi:hypothetical protein
VQVLEQVQVQLALALPVVRVVVGSGFDLSVALLFLPGLIIWLYGGWLVCGWCRRCGLW